jgi:hypothetical protein
MTKTRLAFIASVVALLAAAGYVLPLADWISILAQRARDIGPLGELQFPHSQFAGAL